MPAKSEDIRDTPRNTEERKSKLKALRAHLGEGTAQSRNGEHLNDYSIDNIISSLDDNG